MNGSNLDPIEVAKLVAGLALSQQLAAIVGPYAIILLASVAGAAAALGNTNVPLQRMESFWYFFRACIYSIIGTVPLAYLITRSFDTSWEVQWFFIPVAFLIGYCADRARFASIASFLGSMARNLIKNWVNKGVDNDKNV